MNESLFYFFAVPTLFIGFLLAVAAVVENWHRTPFGQAERRRKANERFKEIISE
jgi:hypothetical protein